MDILLNNPAALDYENVAKYYMGRSLQAIPTMQYGGNSGNKLYVSIVEDGTVTAWSASSSRSLTSGTYAP